VTIVRAEDVEARLAELCAKLDRAERERDEARAELQKLSDFFQMPSKCGACGETACTVDQTPGAETLRCSSCRADRLVQRGESELRAERDALVARVESARKIIEKVGAYIPSSVDLYACDVWLEGKP